MEPESEFFAMREGTVQVHIPGMTATIVSIAHALPGLPLFYEEMEFMFSPFEPGGAL